ncbi:MAG TPA: glucose-6-phosphate dehydrogenase assembly protein OpcA [Terriglobia bacterium]|nr:glucose-6-phosphate dehydrogenase assembly protein OpcA [Terriglobia bacterium]
MPVSKKFKSLTAGELQSANVATLEDELSELWRAAAEDPGSEHPVMRASVLTLLAFVEREEEGRETFNLISHVIAQNPCRAILMVAEPKEKPEGLSAWISAQCHLPPSGARQVCCEQIYVRARGEAVKGLDNVVLPLIIPELPVYLWWRAGRFAPPEFLNQLFRMTNRVLVDSGRFEEPELDLAALAWQVEKFRNADGMAFSDLNWARLTPCRELIAQGFDSAEACSCLQDLSEVSLEWRQGPGTEGSRTAQALLLTAWLGSRLGWQPVSRITASAHPGRVLEFRRGDKPIRVEWAVRRESGKPSTPFRVTLKTGSTPPAQFSVTESEEEGIVRTRAEMPGHAPLERTARLLVMGEVELVNEELKFPERDRVYEEALNLIAGMVEL